MAIAKLAAASPQRALGGRRARVSFESFVIPAQPTRPRDKSTEQDARWLRVDPSNDLKKYDGLGDRIALRSDCPPVFSLPEGAWI
jgi:hypothetical protein